MRFEELSKKHQDFLMYCLSDYIKGKIRKGSMDGIIFPSYDEYKVFFNSKFEGPNLPSHKGTGYHPTFVENLLMS
jgi:hypothetical protein